jgi:TPR repeat protein
MKIPSNAWVSGSNWYCNDGYKKSGNKCVAINITKSNLNTIVDNNQKIKIVSLEKQSSYKDTNLSDALKAIENGESHKIWLSLASEGVDNAQLILGVLYVKGLGVIKSMEDAANWIGLARQNGSMEVSEKAEEVWNEYELWKYE